MQYLIADVRKKIADPSSTNQQFSDSDIQSVLDTTRIDIRYEQLKAAPSFVNAASTNNQPQYVFADFYSDYDHWETDLVLQGNDVNTLASWIVLVPEASDYLTGHFIFQADAIHSGVAPGQWPPVYITGKVYDIFAASADLLDMWAAQLTCKYDITQEGNSFKRSQWMTAKLRLADIYRRQAKPRISQMVRRDVRPDTTNSLNDALIESSFVRGM
jgi:hypothetical protein